MRLRSVALGLALAACTDGNLADDTADTGDTSDTSDTSDTADTGDTDSGGDTSDTSDTGDTADTDSGDTSDTSDTADTGDTGVGPDPHLDALRAFPEGCTNVVPLRPGQDEIGAWAAARITPPATPYTVREVWFSVLGGFWLFGSDTIACDADGPFHLRAMIVSGTAPPDGDKVNPPVAEFVFDAPALAVDAQDRYIGAVLDTPIVLESGESLVIALDSNQPGAARSCFKTCVPAANAPADTQFWAEQSDPKEWVWKELADYATGNPQSNLPKYHFWAELRGDPP